MRFRFLVIGLACAVLGGRAAAASPGEPRPNVILFLVDDLGWQDLSVPLHTERTPFNDRYRTPNLERLAARGLRFTDAYAAAPVCTPSRTAIMTGQCPGRSRITYWTLHKDTDTSRDHPTLRPPPWNMNGIAGGPATLPALLRGAGYTTIHVGKAHFGAHDTPGADPANLGFDVNVAGHASGGPASFYGTHDFSLRGRRGEGGPSVWDVPGLEAYHGRDIYLTEALALEAVKAIRGAVTSGTPFFMNFAPYAVHAPIMVNRRYADRYERRGDLPKQEIAYATMIETYDTALGSLVETLEELGALDRTVIIFTSDNGGLSAHARGGPKHTHNAPLRSGKGSAYEGGVRVPAVCAGPAVAARGGVSTVPIIGHDLYPTILALAGVEVPTEVRDEIDGVDLSRVLRAEPAAPGLAHRDLFWNQPHQWGASGPGIEPFTSIRRGSWKLYYFHADGRFELYDLSTDISETSDVTGAHPARVRTLADAIDAWIDETGAQLSIDKAAGAEIPRPGTAWRSQPR